ncbi:MAG: CDP-glycerol glycerophosphotransferase family protein [Desulfuromonadales bacterium]|nr:CDP-glycerol glycerophosphotransferase family protein [Desulfuromonadales bacterium]
MPLPKLIIEVLLSLLDNLFYGLSYLVPKSPRIWIFGSMFGEKYADNSKYFYDYVRREHREIRAVWLSRSPRTVAAIRERGGEAYRFYSPAGTWLAMRAAAGFISHSVIRDFRPFVLGRNTLLVNLWHGIPLKRIAKDDEVSDIRNQPTFRLAQAFSRLLCPSFRRDPDLTIACSDEDRRSFSSGFRVPAETVVITGYPRNDAMSWTVGNDLPPTARFIGIYMPTFRGQEGTACDFFEPFGFDAVAVNTCLEQLDAHLYLKLHHFNRPGDRIMAEIAAAPRISFFPKDDIYEEMAQIDFLITDYSSIYFDYLLTGRSLIFAPFDVDDFNRRTRTFYYDYDEVTPGPKARSWPEVCTCIREAIEQPDRYAAQRRAVAERFHRFRDGESCRRVHAEVNRRLQRC